MMPKLKMFGSKLFVESRSKLVRVLKVKHFPPGPLSSSWPLHLWSPTWSTTPLRRWYSPLKFSAESSLPLVNWDYPEIERLKETMIDANICKITTLPPPSASLSLFLSTRPTIISIVPKTGARETVKEAAWRVRPRDVNTEQEKSAPFCHQL